jgi:hypothetical protein
MHAGVCDMGLLHLAFFTLWVWSTLALQVPPANRAGQPIELQPPPEVSSGSKQQHELINEVLLGRNLVSSRGAAGGTTAGAFGVGVLVGALATFFLVSRGTDKLSTSLLSEARPEENLQRFVNNIDAFERADAAGEAVADTDMAVAQERGNNEDPLLDRPQSPIQSDDFESIHSSDQCIGDGAEREHASYRLLQTKMHRFTGQVESDAEWANEVLSKFWPRIEVFVGKLVDEKIQPKLDTAMPRAMSAALGRLKLGTVKFGKASPRMGPIVVRSQGETIIIDFGLNVASDVEIGLSTKMVSFGVRRLEFKGTFTVRLREPSTKPPFFSAFEMFFVNPPVLDIQFTGLASIASFPGLSGLIKSTIDGVMMERFVLPARIAVDLDPEDDVDMADIKYPDPNGVLRVTILSAKDIWAADMNLLSENTSDPYVIVELGGDKWQSPTLYKTRQPVWTTNNVVDFLVFSDMQEVKFNLWDDNVVAGDKHIGVGTEGLTADVFMFDDGIMHETVLDLTLAGKPAGILLISTEWFSLSSTMSQAPAEVDAKEPLQDVAERAKMILLVKAIGLIGLPLSSAPPFTVKVSLDCEAEGVDLSSGPSGAAASSASPATGEATTTDGTASWFGSSIGGAVTGVGSTIGGAVGDVGSSIGGAVAGVGSAIGDTTIGGAVTGVGSTIGGGVIGVGSTIGGGVVGVGSKLGGAVTGVGSAIEGAIVGTGPQKHQKVSKPSIPQPSTHSATAETGTICSRLRKHGLQDDAIAEVTDLHVDQVEGAIKAIDDPEAAKEGAAAVLKTRSITHPMFDEVLRLLLPQDPTIDQCRVSVEVLDKNDAVVGEMKVPMADVQAKDLNGPFHMGNDIYFHGNMRVMWLTPGRSPE